MKKIIIVIAALCYAGASKAQSLNGNWEGGLDAAGKKIPVVFHISTGKDGKYSATFDSPSQQAFNLACGDLIVHADSLVISSTPTR